MPPTPPPPSPCINVCVLAGDGFCIGCLRTGDEIGRWRDMSSAEQWALLRQLEARRQARAPETTSTGDTAPGGERNER
jgi:predicted Fe-S protein YdhL (DUF1289 family)